MKSCQQVKIGSENCLAPSRRLSITNDDKAGPSESTHKPIIQSLEMLFQTYIYIYIHLEYILSTDKMLPLSPITTFYLCFLQIDFPKIFDQHELD